MDDLFGLIVIIIGIAAGIYSDKKKKEGKQKKAAVPNQPGGGRKNVPQTQVSYGGHAGRPDPRRQRALFQIPEKVLF